MKVLYSFPHALGAPGIGTTAINQVRGLAAAGHHVTVYATSLAQPLDPSVDLITTMSTAGIRIPHRALGIDRTYRLHDRIVARFLRRGGRGFDVVHAWPRGCLNTFAAARTSRVISFRESPNPHTAAAFADAARAAVAVGLEVASTNPHYADKTRLAIEAAEYEAADFILAPSDFVLQSYLERHVPPDRLIRHRYGFDPRAFPAPPPRDPSRAFTAVFLGSGEPRKGLHHALQAWSDAQLGPDAQFFIAGVIEPAYRKVLLPLLHSTHAVELGFQRDTGAVLRRSDVLLLPSVSEGSALVTYEAMASGSVPLVSCAAGAPVVDGVDGLVHAVDDVPTLTAQLIQLATDGDRLRSLRDAGLRRREELSWEAAGYVLAEAYRTGIERSRTRP